MSKMDASNTLQAELNHLSDDDILKKNFTTIPASDIHSFVTRVLKEYNTHFVNDDNDEFQIVTTRKEKNTIDANRKRVRKSTVFESENPYSFLRENTNAMDTGGEDDDVDDDFVGPDEEFPAIPSTSKYNSRTHRNNTKTNNVNLSLNHTNTNVNNNNIGAKKYRLPPITIYIDNTKKLINDIKLILNHSNFNIKLINKKCTQVLTNSLADYDLVKKYIVDNDKNHYTYTPKERKNINFIIRGINNSYSPEEIIDEINSLNLENVNIVKCSEYKTRDSIRNNRKLDLFMLSLSFGSDIKPLISIKYLLNQRVYFEKIAQNQECVQCHRCQRFGHSANNCSMKPRCLKCLESHLTTDCDNVKKINKTVVNSVTGITSNEMITVPICTNCGKEGHPANYKNCEARLKYIQNLSKRSQLNKINSANHKKFQLQSVNNYYKPDISFSDQLKKSLPQNTPPKSFTNNYSFFENECQKSFNDSLINIIRKVNNFKPTYISTHCPVERKIALMEFMLTLC